MFPSITEDCLDEWLADFDAFRVDFLKFCYSLSKPFGYYLEFDQETLRIAHENWKSACDFWQNSLIMPNSNGLSHVKILSILLIQLSKDEWIKDIFEFDPQSERDGFEINASGSQIIEIKKDMNAGRGTYFALQFCLMIINWFETARDDRIGEFVYRMTGDLEHDIMVYLSTEARHDMAIYLTLSALYVRDSKGDGEPS